jgi:alpha,alpha-trehalose-phosphate synthase [UDP-forming]
MESVVAYANRLPVAGGRGGVKPAAGGLVAALRPALEARQGSWVGWDGGASDLPRRIEGLDIDLCPVALSRRAVDGHYHGFSNRTLWPLLHGFVEQPQFDRDWWRAYRAVNERFADVDVDAPADAILWVHDYHLMLLPALLRRRRPEARMGFFLHVPFPATELYARLPWREQLLEGLLGADVVAFHTDEYRDNFLAACATLFPEARVDGNVVELRGRRVLAAAHPISVDAAELHELAAGPPTSRVLTQLRRQFAGRHVLFGCDRLDYTKGILERLRAVELLLEQRPELRGRMAFIQVAVPSRGEVREYRALRQEVERTVGRINGRFTEPGQDVPVYYLYRGVPRERLLAYFRLADVCLVTPLRDGMNLVAKEFVVAQAAGREAGVLVLSEFTGAAKELTEALPCNPYDTEGVGGTVELALALEPDDRRRRIEAMAARVAEHDVHWWASTELETIARATRQPAEARGRRGRATRAA